MRDNFVTSSDYFNQFRNNYEMQLLNKETDRLTLKVGIFSAVLQIDFSLTSVRDNFVI